MPGVRVRMSAGIGAWIVGATSATGLSLFAVSHLGTGVRGAGSPTLGTGQVRQELAAMTDGATPSRTPVPNADPNPGPKSGLTQSAPSQRPAASTPGPSSVSAPESRDSGEAATERPVVRRLSVDGGSVVARCQDTTVYLSSWNPAEGYQVESVQRGPADSATVVFAGNGNSTTAHVVCSDGEPSLTGGNDSGAAER